MAYTQSNEIKTRISLKYDSLANWESKNPSLLTGEVAIAYLASSQTTTTPDNGTHPVMFKVGPGNFNALPWTSALAAEHEHEQYLTEHQSLADYAKKTDIPTLTTENWTFTLEDGTIVTKAVYVG